MAGFRWNNRFHINLKSPRAAVIFSTEQFIILSDAPIRDLLWPRKGFPSKRIELQKLTRLLLKYQVLSRSERRSERRVRFGTSSFITVDVQFAKMRQSLRSSIVFLTQRRQRIIYQLGQKSYFRPRSFRHYFAVGVAEQLGKPIVFHCSGADFSPNKAIAKTIGEAIERNALATVLKSRVVYSKRNDLELREFDPSRVVSFADSSSGECIPFAAFSDDVAYYWIPAVNLCTKQGGYIPAQFAHSPYHPRESEPLLWYPNSSGAAAGRNKRSALERGILELIERDSLMLAWYGQTPLQKISEDSLGFTRARHLTRRSRFKLDLLRLPNEFEVPTVLAITRSEDAEAPYISVGSASAWEWDKACRAAIVEAIQNRSWLSGCDYSGIRNPEDVQEFSHHAFLYANRKNSHAFDAVLSCASMLDLPTLERHSNWASKHRRLVKLLASLRAMGYDAWAADLSTSTALRTGYFVLRAFVPGLVPIQFGYNVIPTGLRRLRSVMKGSKAPWPHPWC